MLHLRDVSCRSADNLGFIDQLQDELLYGNTERGLRAGLQDSKATFALFTERACVPPDPVTGLYTMAECTGTYLSGLLGRVGLRSALTEYIQRSTRFLDEQEARLRGPMANCTYVSMSTGLGHDVLTLGGRMLPPAFERAADIHFVEGQADMAAFVSANIAVTVVSGARACGILL